MPIPTGSYLVPDPHIRCEQVLLSYVSSSLAGSGLINPATNFYEGTNNEDKAGPAVIVACNDASETYWQTRVYRGNLDITTKEIAYDSENIEGYTASMINLGGNIHSLFGDSYTASAAINANTRAGNAGSNDLWVLQTQIQNYQSQRIEDSWISNLNITVIFALQPGNHSITPSPYP